MSDGKRNDQGQTPLSTGIALGTSLPPGGCCSATSPWGSFWPIEASRSVRLQGAKRLGSAVQEFVARMCSTDRRTAATLPGPRRSGA